MNISGHQEWAEGAAVMRSSKEEKERKKNMISDFNTLKYISLRQFILH